ncbi:MAG: preprotein translocase subunit SecG [Elusimicrobiaceae bacterium]|jgi:preprotein translocase subunit SecG
MYTLVLIIHFAACFLLIVAVLLQSGKGNAMGVFGGGGSEAVFGGASGTSFVKKFTLGVALVIAVTSVGLTFMGGSRRAQSVVDKYGREPLSAPTPGTAVTPPQGEAEKAAPQGETPAAPAKPVQKIQLPDSPAKK